MRNTARAMIVCLVAASAPIPASAGEADGPRCKRPELVWKTWREHVMKRNPGTRFIELEGPERGALISALGCSRTSSTCPADRSVVFHCNGMRLVLVALIKDGCVTKAEEMSIDRLLGLVGGGLPC